MINPIECYGFGCAVRCAGCAAGAGWLAPELDDPELDDPEFDGLDGRSVLVRSGVALG